MKDKQDLVKNIILLIKDDEYFIDGEHLRQSGINCNAISGCFYSFKDFDLIRKYCLMKYKKIKFLFVTIDKSNETRDSKLDSVLKRVYHCNINSYKKR